ncbi:MAG: universal stress protein [Dysgonamonadaceae bacterium]|jgi:nucleotide-binding universal stress UspA family protein|nr:universal stress protein [Dysgonamonadaceae bacterium]
MENKKNDPQNESYKDGKLVTVAIHTYEKAEILKSILESEGVPAIIESINLIQPVVPGNVRVRINECDLPKALKIIEDVDFSAKAESKKRPVKKEILVPVDFSDYSFEACEFAFRLAKDISSSVKLLHVFFSPYYPSSIGEMFSVPAGDQEIYKEVRSKTEKEMQKWMDKIEEKIKEGALPDVPFSHNLSEGLPEEEIVDYSRKVNPEAIVMGTRGKSAKEADLIGSVTAEVIEGCHTPVFAIPENTKQFGLAGMKKIVFLTNFQERELKAFEIMMKFVKDYPIKVYLAHIAKKEDVWDEIKLAGINKYLQQHYPSLEFEYAVIDGNQGLEAKLDKFVKDNRVEMIAMSSSRRNIFTRVFNPGIARRMLFHSDTPLLVIKGV